MSEEESKVTPPAKKSKILIGFVAVALACGTGFGVYQYLNPEPPPESKPKIEKPINNGIATINIDKILKSHPSNSELESLKNQERRIKLELQTLLKPMTVEAPKVDEKPFDDSVWQKEAQKVIGEMAAIERDQKRAAEQYRNDTEAAHKKNRDEVNDRFLNEILNLKLKIQNRDALRLKDEEVAELEDKITQLQRERGLKQLELLQAWESEIKEYAEASVRERREKLKNNSLETLQAIRDEALQKQADAQARNAEAMKRAMDQSLERQKNRERLLAELRDTLQARQNLENQIARDITDKVSRLAYKHHVDLILATPMKTIDSILNQARIENLEPETSPIISVDAMDLTEELSKDLSRE